MATLLATQKAKGAMNKVEKLLRYRGGWLLICLLLTYSFTELLDQHYSTRPAGQALPVIAMFCNALPAMLIIATATCFTRRLFFSFLLALGIYSTFFTISFLKQFHLGTPLLPVDFRMAGQLGHGGWDILSKYLPKTAKTYIAASTLAVIMMWLWPREPLFYKNKYRPFYIPLGILLAISLGSLVQGHGPWSEIYKTNPMTSREVIYLPTLNAARNGLISTQIQLQIHAGHVKLKGDPKLARAFMDRVNPSAVRSTDRKQLPDIIVIQSEAFFDPSIMNGFSGPSTTIEYSKLASHSLSGPLHVPTIGGGTIRTEFEVMTGIPLRHLTQIQYPYLQLNLEKTPSLVKTLESHGYSATAIHGNDGAFWNRTSIFSQLGFQRFVTRNDFQHAPQDGSYVADRAMTDEIMRRLDGGNSPQFIFAISIEAHGPYATGYAKDASSRDGMPVPKGLSPQQTIEFKTYMYHARHADAELGRLANWLDRRKRPYLLLFYGDHLPALHPIYQQIGFKDGKSEYVQAVPWILVDSRESAPAHEPLAAWMLPDLILEHASIPDDGYFALTRAMRPILSSLTTAPNVHLEPSTEEGKEDDRNMGNLAALRLRGKL